MPAELWTLLDEGGGTAVEFTSFEHIDLRNEGSAMAYPIEEGSFASYDKTRMPLSIRVTLSKQGEEADFAAVLSQLDDFKNEAVKLSVSTPAALYESMTLESYSYRRQREAGAGLLTVDLDLVEVQEVQTSVTTTATTRTVSSPKNATSSATSDTGKTQPQSEGSSSSSGSLFAQITGEGKTRAETQNRSNGG